MSLNYKEINLVLSELSIEGSKIQKVLQPTYDTIIFELFKDGIKKLLLLSVASGACRIHGLSSYPAKNERPLRFMECLRSRLRGGKIEEAVQLGAERIIRLKISTYADQESLPHGHNEATIMEGPLQPDHSPIQVVVYTLYIRLWSGAGNMLLVDDRNEIIDVLLRKPEKGEISGSPSRIEINLKSLSDPEVLRSLERKYSARELPGTGSYSERIERHYANDAGELSRDALLQTARERYERQMLSLRLREKEQELRMSEFAHGDRFRQIGDILMAGEHRKPDPAAGTAPSLIEAFDFFENKTIAIQIEPALGTIENARKYYEKSKKAITGLDDIRNELEKTRNQMRQLDEWLEALTREKVPFAIAKALEKAGTVRETARRTFPCIWLEHQGWTILIGRSAKENDELLRHHVKGSDLWLHARDYSGSYVFVRARKGSTFPLDIMLDAANLAIYYSKARKNMEGDVYHTFVKYLRRVKDGPKGLVIPTLEKNLYVKLDEARIKELLLSSKGNS